VAQEAQFKTSYNISIVGFEEAKGTLLEHKKITVLDRPAPATGTIARRAPVAKSVPLEHPLPVPQPDPVRLDSAVSRAKDEASSAEPAGKTYSFRFTVGRGPRPLDIRGSFTVTPSRSTAAPDAQ
jgi:hypothetical protein